MLVTNRTPRVFEYFAECEIVGGVRAHAFEDGADFGSGRNGVILD
jgi:hypothetical protein